jgi:hypothetical protein
MSLKTKILSGLGALLLSSTLSGCFSYVLKGSDSRPTVERPSWVEEEYGYDKEIIEFKEEIRDTTQNYFVRRITFPSAMVTQKGNEMVTVDYYDTRTSSCEKKPLVLISPILGGDNSASKWFAEYYANNGMANAIVHRPENRFPDESRYCESLEALLKQPVIDMRRVIDLFETFPEIDKNKIGSFGISMGAIRNATFAGIEERCRVNVFAMGGSDIPYILTNSSEEGVVEELNKAMKGIGAKNLLQELQTTIKTDPKYLAQFIDEENTLMYITLFDTVVPTRAQRRLRDSIGDPSVSYLLSGHYTALAFVLKPFQYLQTSSLNFFRNKFGELESEDEQDLSEVTLYSK